MTRFTVEYNGGGFEEFDATSARDARRQAVRSHYGIGQEIVEVRPFAAKRKPVRAGDMPAITVKPDPWEKLRALAKESDA